MNITSFDSYLDYRTFKISNWLNFRFRGKVKHYKLYYDGQHYVRDKKFDSLAALVADGLLIMHMECEAGPYIALMSDAVRYILHVLFLFINE